MIDALNVDAMRRIAERVFVADVYRAFGQPGTESLRELIGFVIRLYAHLDPSAATGTIYVFRAIPGTAPLPNDVIGGQVTTERRIDRLPRTASQVLVIEMLDGGGIRFWENASLNEAVVSASALLYRYRAEQEHFVIKGTDHVIDNPAAIHASIFARPTFTSLRDAIQDYGARKARVATCRILRDVWDDDQRLFLRTKPERVMRDSLAEHLMTVLRDAEVRPEQNVDESHPVDIKATWTFTERLALIEIKWVGKSRTAGAVTVTYADARANAGAEQLADYLDSNRTAAPSRETRGYLVVFDARRRGLVDSSTTISRDDGFHYERRELVYVPAYHEGRIDFEAPIRIFLEPICSAI